jgi:hypothetical protein
VIDLGPEGGDAGGRVIAIGTPEQVAEQSIAPTSEYLRKVLDSRKFMLREDTASPVPPAGAEVRARRGVARDPASARRMK